MSSIYIHIRKRQHRYEWKMEKVVAALTEAWHSSSKELCGASWIACGSGRRCLAWWMSCPQGARCDHLCQEFSLCCRPWRCVSAGGRVGYHTREMMSWAPWTPKGYHWGNKHLLSLMRRYVPHWLLRGDGWVCRRLDCWRRTPFADGALWRTHRSWRKPAQSGRLCRSFSWTSFGCPPGRERGFFLHHERKWTERWVLLSTGGPIRSGDYSSREIDSSRIAEHRVIN